MIDDDTELKGVPLPGEIVVGKYQVERVLGAGGMGAVVSATHLSLEHRVAIKFLLARAARNPKNIQRFLREAKAAAAIQSDHVARVSDIGTLPSGTPYMVMEYLEGEDLADHLAHGAVPVPVAVTYVLQACEALAEAHRAGIVHRDLKPANLFLAQRPDGSVRIKVLDFGISKIIPDPARGEGDNLTRTSALMGSPLYMSPEQMHSAKDADARADIWALGNIVFELITGVPPFRGATLPEICSKILTAPPAPLRELLPSAPAGLDAVLYRCLEKDPGDRYQTLSELGAALLPFAGEDGRRHVEAIHNVLGRPVPAATPPAAPSSPDTEQMAIMGAMTPLPPTEAAPGPPFAQGAFGPAIALTPPSDTSALPVSLAGAPHPGDWSGAPAVHPAAVAGHVYGTPTRPGRGAAPVPGESTAAPVSQTASEGARRSGRGGLLVAALLLTLGGAGALVLFGPWARSSEEPVTAANAALDGVGGGEPTAPPPAASAASATSAASSFVVPNASAPLASSVPSSAPAAPSPASPIVPRPPLHPAMPPLHVPPVRPPARPGEALFE